MGIDAEAIFDDQEVNEFLQGMSSRLKYVENGEKKYTGLLSAIVYGDIMDHFEQQKGSDGPWHKWSKDYAKQRMGSYEKKLAKFERSKSAKKRMPKVPKILQFDGRMRQNFKPTDVKSTSAGPMWFNDAHTKSGFPYAFAHNEGGSILPKRDFMWLSDGAMNEIAEQTLQFMLDEGI